MDSASIEPLDWERILRSPELLDILPLPMCCVSEKGLFRTINRAARDLLEIQVDALEARPFSDWLNPADQLSFELYLRRSWTAKESLEGTFRLRSKDGGYASIRLRSIRWERGMVEPVLLFLLARDRGLESSSTDWLADSISDDQRFHYAVEAVRDGLWDWDIATGNVYYSPQWARLLGFELNEVPQRVESFLALVAPDDLETVSTAIQDHFAGKTPLKQVEVRLRTKSHGYRWFHDTGKVVEWDVDGKPRRMIGSITDITRSRQSQELLEESQARTRLLIEAARLGLWDWNTETNEVYFSPEWKQQLGYEDHELPNHLDEWKSRIHPDDLDRVFQAKMDFFEGKSSTYDIEFRLRHRDQSWRWVLSRADLQRNEQGRPIRMLGCHLDITDRKQAERASSMSLSLLRTTLESTTDGILVVNLEGGFKIFNQVFRDLWGIPSDLVGKGLDDAMLQFALPQLEDPEQFLAKVEYLYQHPEEKSMDTLILKDGRVLERYAYPQLLDGQVIGRIWSFRDVTERKLAEAAKAEALSRIQKIASRIPGVVYQYRMLPNGTESFPYISEGVQDIFRIAPSEFTSRVHFAKYLIDQEPFWQSIMKSASDLTPWVHEFPIQYEDGTRRWLAGNSIPEREPDGSIIWHGVITDITASKNAEARLRESEKRLKEAQAISQIGNFHWDAMTQRVTWSDELYRIYECDPAVFEPTFESYIAAIHEEDRSMVMAALQHTMESKTAFDHQYRLVVSGTGQEKWVRARGNALLDTAGNFIGLEGTCQDITEQKRAEANTASLEMQLRESQKMEAIGTLAGGIAHDFNNILATILGNIEIAMLEVSRENEVVHRSLQDIRNAGNRARDLIQQILSFSRRQVTRKKPIQIAKCIEDVMQLLSAAVPASLTLIVECSSETPLVLADATQIEQVVLNLVTNSIQALHGRRGCIRIQLDSVRLEELPVSDAAQLRSMAARCGRQIVRLQVTDDGPGMSSDTQQRIFEPFFTTKPIGQGTGLGLAVVHGIVLAHEGIVVVDSDSDSGAKFTIYLPPVFDRLELERDEASSGDLSAMTVPLRSHIFYLDDDQGILFIAKQLMERHGWRMSCFSTYQEALDAFQRDSASFDLIITDYNMPGMHGIEVAQEIRKVRQDIPIIVTSGFIDEELTAKASEFGVEALIAKPFRLEQLFAIVQKIFAR